MAQFVCKKNVDSLGYLENRAIKYRAYAQFSPRILELAKPYPKVSFLGYVEDVRRVYSEADLQVVGNTRATGLRTRIVESFLYGVPVLSTVEAAKGVSPISDGRNILLVADARGFARAIADVLQTPACLAAVAAAGHATYKANYSREVSARALSDLLQRYF